MLFSFDIFDTCLVRLCGEPENMIEVLSYKVAELIELKSTNHHITSEHLRRLFVEARRNAGGQLNNVYQQIAQTFPLPCSPTEMIQLELETEREMLVPVLETLELVNKLRAKGEIAFISDMYLPTDFLRDRLSALGFFREGDRIYVSDDLNAWKRDGSLYRLVHKKEDVPYKNWHHYGDNRRSDVRIPRRLGIRSHCINYGYIHYEKQWLGRPSLSDKSLSMMAGLSRAIRLSVKADHDQSAFVADISAPLQCIWMSHVLQDAKRRGIEKLFFCARDVHSAFRVARTLKSRLTEFKDIETTYFFTSQIAVAEGGDLAERYYRQIGMIPTEHVAIVDSRTRGWSLGRLQEAVTHGKCPPMMAYYWHLDTNEKEWRNLLSYFPVESNYHLASLTRNKYSREATLDSITGLFENGLSLNYHHKTVGYALRPNGNIGPIFKNEDDELSVKMPNVRRLKHDNDEFLVQYASGFAACGLDRHCDTLINTLLIPTLIDFASQPNKLYLRYLNKLWILGVNHPYVSSIYKLSNRKGRWLFGSIVYSLPTPLDRIYCTLRYTKVGRKIRKIGYKLTKKTI